MTGVGISIRWTGWDGSVWDLRNGDVRLTDGGIQGLGMLEHHEFTQDSAMMDGQRLTGWRGKPRAILLPVKIGHTRMTEAQYLDVDRRWGRTMRPGKYGTLTVTTPDGSWRELRARFVDDGGLSLVRDPLRDRTVVIPYRLTADNPWWLGDPFTNEFRAVQVGERRNFFGGGELGVEYSWLGEPHLSMSRAVSTARSRTNRHVRPNARSDWALLAGSAPSGVVIPQHLRGSNLNTSESYFSVRIGSQQAGTTRFGVGANVPSSVEALKQYSVTVSGRSVIDRESYVLVEWLDAALAPIGTVEGTHEPHKANQWQARSVSVVAPAKAAAARVWIVWDGAAPVGNVDGTAAAIFESPTLWDYFDGGSGKGPLFTIGKSTATTKQQLVNPGDVPVWPTFTIEGPLDGFSFKVGTGILSSSHGIAGTVVIETSPTLQTVRGTAPDGTKSNWLRNMQSLGYRSVPEGGAVDVVFDLQGSGSVTVTGTPRYFKAWG